MTRRTPRSVGGTGGREFAAGTLRVRAEGYQSGMILAFLSARIRRWVLLVLVLPLAGRLLETLGVRLGDRRSGRLLRSTGGRLRGPRTDPSRRRRR